jgi:uncharacterized protein
LINRSKEIVVAREVQSAKNLWARMQGLLGRSSLASDVALWISPCNSIHTFFMKFAIDAIFVDENLVVRKVVREIKPWRLIIPVLGARSVFEMAAGQARPERVSEGDRLHVGH